MSAQLSEKARAYLQERRFAVLATLNIDGTPQLTTMWYMLEGDTILMNTKAGRAKERNMRREPHISICVEDGYNYVTISGTAELIDDPTTAQNDIYRLAARYEGEESAQKQMSEGFSKETRVTIHLKTERIIEYLD